MYEAARKIISSEIIITRFGHERAKLSIRVSGLKGDILGKMLKGSIENLGLTMFLLKVL